jgi:hypothetical protein
MKYTVPQCIELQTRKVRYRVPRAEHVVPLQKLVEDDAIDETAKTQAKKNASCRRERALHRVSIRMNS